jgi:hypothetical protein
VIRAEIRDGEHRPYRAGDIEAATLPVLCIALLKAGYDPEAEVQCFRAGRPDWQIRARTIAAAAMEAAPSDEGSSGIIASGPPQKTHRAASTSLCSRSKGPGKSYDAKAVAWDGPRLRLRASGRVLAALEADAEYRSLVRVRVGPDLVSDLLSLTRAREAAVLLAVRTLNAESKHRQFRKAKGRPLLSAAEARR